LNQRPSGYEPDELPDCSTPRRRSQRSAAADGIQPGYAVIVVEGIDVDVDGADDELDPAGGDTLVDVVTEPAVPPLGPAVTG
jgi:hypothetical protein